ncbi:hypothetical protein HWB81_gp23 [Bacillus phage Wes44]|uniref:Uncharacterized protein n=1 Tax=Bacillus phage Wes44 TaxID=2283012 RepID=A0A346FK27_9CAUD|nr:hypothetical protein HWB81_gp23 [Bacillus phage Wes44]AXN58332.1 hypothetical protein Wes44_23 [Bacillus phage Wes44]
MFKFLNGLFSHVHCFCDKKQDFKTEDGKRIIVMACNKCGLEDVHVSDSK